MDALLVFIHFIQASIPFFRCSGVEFCLIFSNSGPEAIYSAMNFFIGSHLAKLQFRSGDFVSRGVNAPKSCSRITDLTPRMRDPLTQERGWILAARVSRRPSAVVTGCSQVPRARE